MPHSGGTPESLIICLAAIKGKYRFNALKVIKKLMISGPLYFRGKILQEIGGGQARLAYKKVAEFIGGGGTWLCSVSALSLVR